LSSSGATGQPRSVALPSTTGCPQSPESGASSRPDGCAESASHRPSFDGGPCLLCGGGGLSRRGGLPCVLPGGTPPVAGDGARSRVFVPPTAVTFDPGPALSGRPSVCRVRDREVPPTRISLRRVRAHTSRRRPANAPGFIPGHRHASGASTHVSGHLPWVRNVVGGDGALTGGGLCRGLATPLGLWRGFFLPVTNQGQACAAAPHLPLIAPRAPRAGWTVPPRPARSHCPPVPPGGACPGSTRRRSRRERRPPDLSPWIRPGAGLGRRARQVWPSHRTTVPPFPLQVGGSVLAPPGLAPPLSEASPASRCEPKPSRIRPLLGDRRARPATGAPARVATDRLRLATARGPAGARTGSLGHDDPGAGCRPIALSRR
jgi:hypothetical protein